MNGAIRILIVENERITAEDLSRRLQKLGYAVSGICATGEAAIRITETDPPNLIFMDIQLNGRMTGDQAADIIRKSHRIPVVYLTAYSDTETLNRVKLTEPFGFLVKPYIDSELRGVIETAIYKHGMELRLRESELRFSRLVEASFEGIGISDHGVVIDANNQLAIMLGYRPDEIIGKNAMDFAAPESRDLVLKNIRTGFEGPYEHQAIRKDGSIFPVEVRAKSLPFKGRIVRVTAIRDITERKKMEQALRYSEHRYQELIESARDAIFSLSMEGVITSMNKAFENLTGWKVEEWIGKPFKDLIHPEDIPKALQSLSRMLKGHSGYALELRIRKKSGETFFGEIVGSLQVLDNKIMGFLCVGRDISERKRVEEALNHSIEENARVQRLLLALNEASRNVLHIRTPDAVFQAIGNEIAKLGYNAAIFTLTDDRAHLIVSHLTFHGTLLRKAEKLTGLHARDYRFPLHPNGFFQSLIASGKAELTDRNQGPIAEALPPKMRPIAGRLGEWMGITKTIYVPLKINGEAHSLLTVLGADLTEADLPAMIAFANQAEIAVENALLYQATQQEISERQRVEEELRQSENRYRSTIEAMGDSIHVVDQDLRFVLVNETFKTWNRELGLQTDSIGKNLFDVFPFLPGKVRTEYRRVFRTGKTLRTEETSRVGEHEIVTETRKIPILENGKVIRVVTVIRDITLRKSAELALLKSEEKFSKAFRTSPTPIVITRLKDRLLIEVNEAFERLSGFRHDEAVGRTARDLGFWVDPKDQDAVFRILMKKGRVLNQEYRFRVKDGSVIVCRYSAERIDLEGEACILVSLVDLTDLKKAEEAVRESENKFRTIIEQAVDGFILIDVKGRILEWNLAQEKISGLKRADALGRDYLDIQNLVTPPEARSPERLASYRRAFADALLGGQSSVFNRPSEAMIIHPSGQRRVIQQILFPIKTDSGFRIGAIINDITARKQAEEALKESEEKYRYIVERANDGFAIVTDGIIVFANNKTAEISGYPLTKIIGMPFEKMLAPEEAPVIKERYRRRITGENVPSIYETKAFTKDGRRIDVEFCIDLIHYQGNLAAFVMIRNITERKKVQEALEKAQRSYHLASLGTLAAGISHEINQPLTALKVKVDGLLYWGEKRPELMQKNMLNHLQFVSDEADKIDQIIKHMRSLIRHEKPHVSPVDLNETVRKACSFIGQQLASHGIKLKLRLSRAVPWAMTNPMSFEQVIVNLIQNAMNALDKLDKPDKFVILSTRIVKDSCVIDVSDNGPGISSSHMDRIFDPLFTTENEGKGMGLGLSIVQHFVNEMGGAIRVKNNPAGGARFTILIPLYHSRNPEA